MNLSIPKPIVDYKAYKLTSKQARFVELIVSDGNIARYKAYMQVYGTKSEASAASGQAKLMAKSNIQDYKAALEGISASRALDNCTINSERVLKEEACIAFMDIGAIVNEEGFFIQNIKDLPEEIRRNISGLEISERVDPTTGLSVPYYKLKFNDKGASLRRLEQHLGMLNDKVEIGVEVTLKGLIMAIDGKATGQPMIPHLKGD